MLINGVEMLIKLKRAFAPFYVLGLADGSRAKRNILGRIILAIQSEINILLFLAHAKPWLKES
jgi:hypothetical protein